MFISYVYVHFDFELGADCFEMGVPGPEIIGQIVRGTGLWCFPDWFRFSSPNHHYDNHPHYENQFPLLPKPGGPPNNHNNHNNHHNNNNLSAPQPERSGSQPCSTDSDDYLNPIDSDYLSPVDG